MSKVMLASADKELKKRIANILKEIDLSISIHTEDWGNVLADFKTTRPDVLVLDLFITGVYGFDLLKKLNELNDEACVIVISPLNHSGLVEKLFRYGAKDVLLTPFQDATLASTLLHRMESN